MLRRKQKFFWSLIIGSLAVGAWGGIIAGQEPPLSRDMQLGIFYFKKGEDSEAMDRFIEVLNAGNPTERTLANQYLNRITRRLSGTESVPQKPAQKPEEKTSSPPSSTAPAIPSKPAPSSNRSQAQAAQESSAASQELPATPPQAQKQNPAVSHSPAAQAAPLSASAIQEQIKGKIRSLADSGLGHLKRVQRIVIVRKKDGRPWAIALPSELLFEKQIAFRNRANQIISNLASVTYGEGQAKVFVFPEGAALGDVKVMDMRRAVALADSLVSLGISPSRVQAELLTGGSYRIPSSLLSFKGIILVFDYHSTLNLKAPPDEAGPPLSMGLSTPRFRVDQGQGVLIEFSVQKPHSGVSFWRFKILGPENAKPKTIEEVVGSGPVFHQVYWDGRKDYSGSHEPYGFYECLLTAKDGSGRTRAIHRWVELAGPPGTQYVSRKTRGKNNKAKKEISKLKPAAKAAKVLRASKTLPLKAARKSFRGKKKVSYVQLRANRKKKMKPSRHGKKIKPRTKGPRIASAIVFKMSSYQLSKAMKSKILKLARGMAKNKKVRYDIIGYAKPVEKNAKNLCRQRAQIVAGLLINKYRINFKRLKISGKVSSLKGSRVIVLGRMAVNKKRRIQKRGRKVHR
jgi:outer membrane protein OmpA-like peptidoglycan-associated protein